MSELAFRPLEASDIEVRVAACKDNGCQLLLYKDARCDMRLLDEAVGSQGWQCRYEEIDGDLYCSVGVRDGDGEWVWKQDVGTPSNMEGEKGRASDAFKRACFKWGIGRELYTAPFIWVGGEDCKIVNGRNGNKACHDRFSVDSIEVEDGRIESVSVRNDSTGRVVYPKSGGRALDSKRAAYLKRVEELQDEAISLGIKREGISEYVESRHGKSWSELSCDELADVGEHVKQLIEDMKKIQDGAA